MNKLTLLKQPIGELVFSDDFIKRSGDMGFGTLEEILTCEPKDLVNLENFNYSWLAELTTFLSEKGLLYLLQTMPGKSYD